MTNSPGPSSRGLRKQPSSISTGSPEHGHRRLVGVQHAVTQQLGRQRVDQWLQLTPASPRRCQGRPSTSACNCVGLSVIVDADPIRWDQQPKALEELLAVLPIRDLGKSKLEESNVDIQRCAYRTIFCDGGDHVSQISRIPRGLACPLLPTMMWSCTAIPSGFAISMIALVIWMSVCDGEGSPEGWLWLRIALRLCN